MPVGPGRYNEVCTYVRKRTRARGVILIVFGGDKGEGFEVQAAPALVASMPTILRAAADQIEADMKPFDPDVILKH